MITIAFIAADYKVKYKQITKMTGDTKYKIYEDRINSAIAKIAIKYIIKKRFPELNKAEMFFTDKGKPFFKDNRLHCSISHSKNYIVAAVSSVSLGIDIEAFELRSNTNMNVLAENMLNEQNLKDYFSIKNNNEKIRFLKSAWTAKESCLKLTGEGLIGNLRDIGLFYDKNEIKGVLHKSEFYHIKQLKIGKEAVLSLCTEERACNVKYIDLTENEIVEWYIRNEKEDELCVINSQ